MGFMDELKKLTKPYDDEEDDFFEGADASYKSTPAASPAQLEFEHAFGEDPSSSPEPASKPARPAPAGGLLGARTGIRPVRPKIAERERSVYFGGSEQLVILFNPRTFDEAGELVNHLNQGRSLVMTLEGLPTENARRLLDFLSGITFALQGKITPVSAKTYFVTPQNVDILGAQAEQPESDGQYF